MHAVESGHRDTARLLVSHEAEATGWTPLICGAILGDLEMVNEHIDQRRQRDNRNRIALLAAAEAGQVEAVRALMEHEGDVSGWTKLMHAAYCGDTEG